MFSLETVRKAGEVLGVVNAPVEVELEDQEDTVQSIKPVEYINVTIKQVGAVEPTIIDPQKDLEHLIELFGVMKPVEKVMLLECPECEAESYIPYQSVPLDHSCTCESCGHEDEFVEFYEETEEKSVSSRIPSDDEVALAANVTNQRHYNMDGVRERLLTYYNILLGNEGLLDKGHAERGAKTFVGEPKLYQCSGCSGDCRCNNSRMSYYGKVKSLQAEQLRLAEEEEE